MIEHPLLLETSVGTIAGVVTLPDDAPVAGVVIFEGVRGTRAGANQLWVRLARALGEVGVATLRADYAGVGESWDARGRNNVKASCELGRWFADRVGDILIVSECYGLTPGRALCGEDVNVTGVALVAPPLYPDKPVPAPPRSLRKRIRRRVTRVRSWRATRRAQKAEDVDAARKIADVVRYAPTRIITGDQDLCFEPLKALLPDLEHAGSVDFDVVEGLWLHGARTAAAQAIVVEHLTAWVHQSLRSVGERV